ncbi:MAG: potassium channel protein [Dehalococcoidia bacterium]|nr:potassium channel protein [Dehalococcoidia bacterium]
MAVSRRLWAGVGILTAILVTGTVWYWLVEDFGFLDGMFMAVTTITTVGYREVHPLDTSGRLFTMVYLLGGVGVVFYTAVALVEAAVAGDIAEALGGARLSRKVGRMQDHIVLCGFGRVGEEIARQLRGRKGSPQLVVIDKDPARREPALALGGLAVVGDATEEEVLRAAGVERARVLIAAADSDTQNTFVALTARALNPQLVIIARAGSESAEARLRTAGANRIISPYRIAGRRIALAAVQPQLLDFAEGADGGGDAVNTLAEVAIGEGGPAVAGKTLGELLSGLRATRVLGVERAGGEVVVGPDSDLRLRAGDRLMLYGDQQEIEELAAHPITTPSESPQRAAAGLAAE